MSRAWYRNTFEPHKVKALSPERRTFLRSLKYSKDYISFWDERNLMLARKSAVWDAFHTVRCLTQLRRLCKVRLMVYFVDGRGFPLSGVRSNKNGCIRLLLPHPIIIKPKILWFYAHLYPEWSYFRWELDTSFPLKDMREVVQHYLDATEPLEEERDKEGEEDRKAFTAEEEQERAELLGFLHHYTEAPVKNLYLFFRHSPFNEVDQRIRAQKLKGGDLVLQRYIEAKARSVEKEKGREKK